MKPKLNKQDLLNIASLLNTYQHNIFNHKYDNKYIYYMVFNVLFELKNKVLRKLITISPNGCTFKLKEVEKNAIFYMRNELQIFGSGESEKSIYTLLEINQ